MTATGGEHRDLAQKSDDMTMSRLEGPWWIGNSLCALQSGWKTDELALEGPLSRIESGTSYVGTDIA